MTYSGKGKVVFKSSWIKLACSKQGMVGLIAFIVVDVQRELQPLVCRKRNILSNKHLSFACF